MSALFKALNIPEPEKNENFFNGQPVKISASDSSKMKLAAEQLKRGMMNLGIVSPSISTVSLFDDRFVAADGKWYDYSDVMEAGK